MTIVGRNTEAWELLAVLPGASWLVAFLGFVAFVRWVVFIAAGPTISVEIARSAGFAVTIFDGGINGVKWVSGGSGVFYN